MIRRKSGVNSAYLNLPQEFLIELKQQNINSLLVLYNSVLAAFPNVGPDTEQALLTFFQKHTDLQKLFVKRDDETTKETEAKNG
jgi:hypothetical protein